MADVRFLRHLRDTNPKKTTLVRGKRVTHASALEAKLAAAKEGESDILAKLESLRGHGTARKAKQENNEKRYQWLTEAKALNQTEHRIWHMALDTLNDLCHRIDAEEGAPSLEDIREEANSCETARIVEQQTISATLSQIKETFQPVDHSKHQPSAPARHRGAPQLKKAATRGRDRTWVEHKLGLVRNLKAQQTIELERLEQEQAEHTSLVDYAAKFIASLEAEERQRQQEEQDERILAMGAIAVPGSEKIFHELYERVCEIDDAYVSQLRALQLSDTSHAGEEQTEAGDSSGEEEAGGGGGVWTPRKHARFIKVMKAGAGRKGEARGRTALLKQLQRELPDVDPAQIAQHLDDVHRRKFQGFKRAALQREWLQKRNVTVETAASALQEVQEEYHARLAMEEVAQEQEVKCQEARGRLAVLREAKEQEQAERKVREEEAARVAAEEDRRRAALVAEERARIKADIHLYKAKKQRAADLRKVARAFERWRGARRARETAQTNAVRVNVRVVAYKEKMERIKERQREEESALAEQQLRLERLRAMVAPEVEADPDRVHAETNANKMYKEGLQHGDKETGTRLYAVNAKNFYSGYTFDRLMGDTRHRLAVALHENGLAGTQAGREALMQIKGSLIPRKDMFTSEQLGGLVG